MIFFRRLKVEIVDQNTLLNFRPPIYPIHSAGSVQHVSRCTNPTQVVSVRSSARIVLNRRPFFANIFIHDNNNNLIRRQQRQLLFLLQFEANHRGLAFLEILAKLCGNLPTSNNNNMDHTTSTMIRQDTPYKLEPIKCSIVTLEITKNKNVIHFIWLIALAKSIVIVKVTHWPSLIKKKDGSNAENSIEKTTNVLYLFPMQSFLHYFFICPYSWKVPMVTVCICHL